MLLFCIIGFVTIGFIGALLHFVYDWLKHNSHVSLFVAVNESTWEHLKLAMLPTFVWAIVGLFFRFPNYAFAVFIVLTVICVMIPSVFYTYTSITKKPILAVDISSFFIAIMLAMFLCYRIMSAGEFAPAFRYVGIIGTCFFALSFLLFTYFPPHIFLFRDPITNKYGRAGHSDDERFGNVSTKEEKED